MASAATLDDEQRYDAVRSRDTRFDGWFVTAVRTTGIYCRPSCPAMTPKRGNVEFLPTSAAAQLRGYRACKRCRPDASPGSPEWNMRHDVVARAMRLIADGVVDRGGVPELAHRLGYSQRHLNRLLVDELGAGALAIARAQRAHTARLLIETTELPLTDVAFAAGFGSVRQFNDTVREVFAAAPSDLRQRRRRDAVIEPGTVRLRLAARAPFDARHVLEFLGARAIDGVEDWSGTVYRRSLRLPGGNGVVTVEPVDGGVSARFELEAWSDLATAVARVRRLLDLDADAPAIDAHLGADARLRPFVEASPGRRAPGALDPFELTVRAIIGQQVSVAGARTVTSRLVDASATARTAGDHRLFPDPDELLAVPDDAFSMPTRRRDTLRRVARAVLDGELQLDSGADPAVLRSQLLAINGIGPWTADYVTMRALGHPDVFLDGDVAVRHGLREIGATAADAARWAPWRTYATHHLWRAAALRSE